MSKKAGLIGIAAVAAAGVGAFVYDPGPTPTPTPTPSTSTFLHLSDIHFDPFSSGVSTSDLLKTDASGWKALFEKQPAGSPVTGRKQDSNYALLKSTLSAAAKAGSYDFVLYTGDYLVHGYEYKRSIPDDKKAEMAAKIVDFVNIMIKDEIGDIPIVSSLGNNDAGCGDYKTTPEATFLKDLEKTFPGATGAGGKKTDFEEGGYFVTPHPTVPDVDFVTLGIMWSAKYYVPGTKGCTYTGTPAPSAAQMDWLGTKLGDIKTSKRKAILLMHIPPGMDAHNSKEYKTPDPLWKSSPDFVDEFEGKLKAHKDILVGGYAGHTHMDEFRVLGGTSPYVAIKMAPSVTPYNSSLPAFTIVDYDTSTGAALNYQVHSYRGHRSGGAFSWRFEYDFHKEYGYSSYSAANVAALANRIQTDSTTRDKFTRFYRSKNYGSAGSEWQYAACALSEVTATEYTACLKNPGSTGGEATASEDVSDT